MIIKVDTSAFMQLQNEIRKEAERRIETARPLITSAIMNDINEYVPYKTGTLCNSGKVANDGSSIIYETNYAEYVYNMSEDSNWTKTFHPKATSHWDEYAYEANKQRWMKMASKILAD